MRSAIHDDPQRVPDDARRWKPGDTGDVLFDPDRPDRAMWLGRAEEHK